MIKFTQLTDKLKYPAVIKGELSTYHASIVTYVIDNFQNRVPFKSQVVAILNTVSYYMVNKDSLPSDWSPDEPFTNLETIDQSACEDVLGDLFLRVRDITWDIVPKVANESMTFDSSISDVKPSISTSGVIAKPESNSNFVSTHTTTHKTNETDKKNALTPKEHLYIRPPVVPQFDASKPWLQQVVNNVPYTIFKSLPEIPIIQNQVSITTDVNMMTVVDLMKLYPNCYIKTRPACMYEFYQGLTLDDDVGIIIPVNGFSPKQVRDNVIKYPHWFKLTRFIDGEFVNFYQHIEIDGKLHDTLSIWDSLPESKKMPRTADFIKEYTVRRYLLERDLKGIQHVYPMFGTLEPFMILFTSPDEYKRLGYKDVSDYAKQCVLSRVNYKRSRNPILRACAEVM